MGSAAHGRALRAAAAAIEPPPTMSVSGWADRYREVQVSPRPGRWDTAVVPFAREPMDALDSSDPCEEVVLAWASQIAKTEIGLNWLGKVIHLDPDACLMARPTDQDINDFTKDRLKPMFRSTPELAARVPETNRRDNENTLKAYRFPGGFLRIVSASSGPELRSTPARNLFLDEVDAFDSIPGEGHPVEIVRQRAAAFRGRRKVLYVSTPTIKGHSRIESLYAESDRRRYQVPCPHCGEYQVLDWHRVDWSSTGVPEDAVYVCAANGCVIVESDKHRMIPAGRWVAELPERSLRRRGYALSCLYCLGLGPTWAELAREFVDANAEADPIRRRERLQAFVNLKLGEPWEVRDGEDQASASDLMRRREAFWIGGEPAGDSPAEQGARLPVGCVLLTAGADVQGDRLEMQVDGWGAGLERWVLDHHVLYGQTDLLDSEVWQILDQRLLAAFPHVSGAELVIQAAGIDSRYNGHVVMPFCAARWDRRVWPVKGDGTGAEDRPIWPGKISRPKAKGGDSTGYVLGVHQAKSHVFARLRGIAAPGPGYSHFPHVFWSGSECDAAYFEQLTAETLRYRHNGRRHVAYYHCSHGRRNEALDLTVYAYAALLGYASARGLTVTAAIAEAQRRLDTARPADAPPPKPPPPARPAQSWLSGGRARGGRWIDG